MKELRLFKLEKGILQSWLIVILKYLRVGEIEKAVVFSFGVQRTNLLIKTLRIRNAIL